MDIELDAAVEIEYDAVGQTKKAYEAGAHLYAEGGLRPRTMERELSILAKYLSGGARVMDAGCGPGRDLKEMAAMGWEVLGVDNSSELLAMVPDEIPTLEADLRAIPLPDGSLDGIWANASLLHLPRGEMPKALTEMRRLLKLGGHFYVSVKMGEGEDWVAERGMAARFFTYYQAEELDHLLAEAGFVIEYTEVKPGGPSGRDWLTRIAQAVT